MYFVNIKKAFDSVQKSDGMVNATKGFTKDAGGNNE